MLGRLLRMFAAPADPPAERRPVRPTARAAGRGVAEPESPSDESPGADSPAADRQPRGRQPGCAGRGCAGRGSVCSGPVCRGSAGGRERCLERDPGRGRGAGAEPEPVEEAHGEPPAPQPAAAAGAELALAVSIMRAAPDVRYRAARSLGSSTASTAASASSSSARSLQRPAGRKARGPGGGARAMSDPQIPGSAARGSARWTPTGPIPSAGSPRASRRPSPPVRR